MTMAADQHPVRPRKKPQANSPSTSLKRHHRDDDQPDEFGHLQKSLNLPGDNSVYRTVCWMLRWPR